MNIKSLNRKMKLLEETTKFLVNEVRPKKEKYSKAFTKLGEVSPDFRLKAFQDIHDRIKKAENAAALKGTAKAYLGLMKTIEDDIIRKYNDTKSFDTMFYTNFFRQFIKIKSLMLQAVKRESASPRYADAYGTTDGKGVIFPTTAQYKGVSDEYKDAKGKTIPATDIEAADKEYKALLNRFILQIGIDKTMNPSAEQSLDSALNKYSDAGESYIEEAKRESTQLVADIDRDLKQMDPSSSEVESAVDDVDDMLSEDELSELESDMEEIEKMHAEGMHIPHPDFDPSNPNSPGYEETMNADYVDMTVVNNMTDSQRLAIRALEIQKRGEENRKAKKAYRNRTPEQILADQLKRQKEKTEKEKRVLSKLEMDDLTPTQIVKLLQDEYGDKIATKSKKQSFKEIGLVSMAMKATTNKEEEKALKSAIATIRQRLQKDFAKTKFLQHDEDELADVTEFLIEVYYVILEEIFSDTETGSEDPENLYDETKDNKAILKAIEDMKEKMDFDAISSYYRYNELADSVSEDLAEIDEMTQEERYDLKAKVDALNDVKRQSDPVRAALEGFTGLRHLATSSTYDYYAKNVWARAEKELKTALNAYCDTHNLPKEVMISKSILDKVTYYAMGRTYFGEIEGHPMSERTPEVIQQFAYDLIGHRMGSTRGASIPKVAKKTKLLKDFNLTVDQAKELAEDCLDKDGIIGSVIHRIFAPEYDEVSLLEEIKKFYRSRGPAYLFAKAYEGMLYGVYYEKMPLGVELPEAFKTRWMYSIAAYYKMLNAKSVPPNKLENELKELIGG